MNTRPNSLSISPNPLKPLSFKDDLDGKPLIPVFDRLFTFSAYVAKHMPIRGALAANHHHALDDAKSQALHLIKIWERLHAK